MHSTLFRFFFVKTTDKSVIPPPLKIMNYFWKFFIVTMTNVEKFHGSEYLSKALYFISFSGVLGFSFGIVLVSISSVTSQC